jgi:hypothetical protein
MANTKKFSKTRKNSFKKRNNKLNTQKGGIFGIKTPQFLKKTPQIFKKTPEKCINYNDMMKIVCKNKQILEALLKERLVSKNINGQVNKYEYDLEQLKKNIETKYNNMNNTHNTINLKTENLADIYAGLSKEVKNNKYIQIETQIKNKMKLMKDNKEYILTIIKFIFSINDNNDEFLNKVKELLDRYIHDRESQLIYSYMPNKQKQGKSIRMEELEFFNKEFDNYLKTIEERLTEIGNININKLLEQQEREKQQREQQEREKQQREQQQEQQQIALVQEQQQKEKKEQQKETLKDYFLDVSSQFKNSKGKKIQRIHFIGRIDDNNNTLETIVERLPKNKINPDTLALLKQTFTEKEELIDFLTKLKKEALRNYFYNTSEIQKNYNGKVLNKRIHILTKKKINNVNKKVSNNTKVNNTVNSLFKQGHKSYIQPEMLTLLKNTFTSKGELLEFLRDLKAEINLPEKIYESMNNASDSKTEEQLNIEKDLKTYFKNNKKFIDRKWLEIIREDSRSYTVKQAIRLIFCSFIDQDFKCKIDIDNEKKLINYANRNIKTLLDFIDNLDNESVYMEMTQPKEHIYENQNSIQLREYFVNKINISKINMTFFDKIKEFVKNNQNESVIENKGPYNISYYENKKYTFDEIVENLFSCDIKKNNKTTMKCKIEIDMIKKLKEYTKNIKTLVEFLSELLENVGINTNEYASLEEIPLSQESPYTSYNSKINSIYQNYPPGNIVNNSGYAHLQKNPGTKTHKNTTYSQVTRSNTVYAEPNPINNNHNDTYATVSNNSLNNYKKKISKNPSVLRPLLRTSTRKRAPLSFIGSH